MPADLPPDRAPAPVSSGPAPRRFGRFGLGVGGLVALLVVVALAVAGWYLTRPATPGNGQGGGGAVGQGGGPGGPGGGFGGGARGGPPTTVGVAVAERSDLSVTLEALGTVTPLATVKVRPQVGGVLQDIRYQEGQMVKKGDLLATIDPRPFEMALQQATGARMRDEAQLDAARVTLQRFQTLLKQDSIARQDVDTQAALVKQLEAAVVVDKANEGTARLNLSYTRITAPIAGRVGLRTVDIGNVVSTGDANGVAVITQLSPIDVQFAVPQDQVGAVMAGGNAPMPVTALDRTRSQELDKGSFTSLDNAVDTTTGTVKAKARFTNTRGALFPSQFVNVQLQLRTIEGAVTVPVNAVRQGPRGDQVFVINPDRTVTLRTVRRGQSTVDRIQIVEGLQAGERVVTEGADRLRDGARVLLPGDQPMQGRRGGASGVGGSGGRAPLDGSPAAAASAPASATAGQPTARDQPPAAPREAVRNPQNPPPQAAQAPQSQGQAGPTQRAAGPTPEQRQRMLDSAAGNPEQLERRKKFIEALDRGDPDALERWQQMQQRMRERQGQGQ